MPFKTKCPGCAKILDVPDSVAGKKVKCPACAHMWQVPAPTPQNQAAFSAPPAAAGPMGSKCPGCGKSIQVPDSMVGKRVKCPACSHVWQIPRPVVDAEADPGSRGGAPAASQKAGWFDDMMSDDYPIAASQNFSGGAPGAPASSAEPARRPCPRCGEMIAIGAAKCRFCDAIFDEKLRKSKKKKKKSSGGSSSSDDDELNGVDWVLCILCSGIGCILGIVYMIQGKPKGGKMILIAIVVDVIKSVIGMAIQSMNSGHGPGR